MKGRQYSNSDTNKVSVEDLKPFFKVGSTVMERIKFIISDTYTRQYSIPMGNDLHDWDEVLPRLFLGVIPTKEDAKNIVSAINGLGQNLGLVVSVVEPWELKNKQTPADWMSIDHYLLPVRDYTADVTPSNVYEAIHEMRLCIEERKSVYLHCKAGRGRSATILACYIAAFECGPGKWLPADATPEDIREFIQKRRRQISLHKKNFDVIRDVKQHLFFREAKSHVEIEAGSSIITNLDDFFASNSTKKAIKGLGAFKELVMYAENKCGSKRAKHISDFLVEISNAKDAQWYIDFVNGAGMIKDLLDAIPHCFFRYIGFSSIGKPEKRLNIYEELKAQLKEIVDKEFSLKTGLEQTM
jgi:atypical dual specificity phosphatase